MAIAVLGINHASAPLHVRERVAFDPSKLAKHLNSLATIQDVMEGLILSTCNRTEIYISHTANVTDTNIIKIRLLDWLHASHALDDMARVQIESSVYFASGQDCLRHLLGVACGLDSMVIGEPQVFGQVKSAYQAANVHGTVKQELDNLFQFVFRTAKRIRTETKIGNHAVSLASAGVQLGRKIFSDFEKHTALLVGAGETIQLVAQHLQQHGLTRMVFANRSVENANKLAHSFQAYSIDLEDIGAHLFEADMLFTSTASPDPILEQSDFIAAIKQRKQKPMFVVDLAVPRDIEANVKELENIYLYSIDDLQDIVSGNQKARLNEAEKARDIVSEALGEFNQAQNLRIASPAIRQLREHYEQQRDDLLGSALEKLNNANAEKIITQLAHQLTNRLLHHPTKELRSSMVQKDSEKMQQLLNLLLPDDDSDKDG